MAMDSSKTRDQWLVVGDGDLSYSATIAESVAMKGRSLVATVLEDQGSHERIYRNSALHVRTILDFPAHTVKFSVDGRKLEETFPNGNFSIIEFNFPHWKGKNNTKQNRQLLSDFFGSARKVLARDGEIRVAVTRAQGGMHATSMEDWNKSWLVTVLATEQGLVVKEIDEFLPRYCLSSHRGQDRPFATGQHPMRYTFGFPRSVGPEQQPANLCLCCHNELAIKLDPNHMLKDVEYQKVVDGTALRELISLLSKDSQVTIQVVGSRLTLPQELRQCSFAVVAFEILYVGHTTRSAFSRAVADECRQCLEFAVRERWGLEVAKGGQMVSKLLPLRLYNAIHNGQKSNTP